MKFIPVALTVSAFVLGACQTPNGQTAQIKMGDNTSEWANDGECDDPRFVGEGMSDILLAEDAMHDANDCAKLLRAGKIRLIK